MILAQLFLNQGSAKENKNFKCTTQNKEYQFLVGDNFVKLIPDEGMANTNRKMASMQKDARAIHENGQNKWNKIFNLKGMQAKLHIDNIQNPSEINDYFSLQSPQGHKMTYGLECSVI
jgi:hypothetical protein